MIKQVFFRANDYSTGKFGEEAYSVGEQVDNGKKITMIVLIDDIQDPRVIIYTGEVPYCVIPWHMVCRMYYA